MIVVNLNGRLGNQMFQYAFAKQASIKLDTTFILNPIYKNEISKYFILDTSTQILSSKLGIKINTFIFKHCEYPSISQNGWQESIDLKNDTIYNGFFQSKYFICERKILNKVFSIKKKWINLFESKYKELLCTKYLLIHIRRTDYIDFGNDVLGGKNLCLPLSYYKNCINTINNISEYKILCISDDIDFARKNLDLGQEVYFETNETIVDFQLIQNATIVIAANSSFAWWAAYLNNKPNKVVYTPKYWLGFKVNKEYPISITPDSFTPIDVY